MLIKLNGRELGPVYVDPLTVKAVCNGTHPFEVSEHVTSYGAQIVCQIGNQAFEFEVFNHPDAVINMLSNAIESTPVVHSSGFQVMMAGTDPLDRLGQQIDDVIEGRKHPCSSS